MSELGRPTLFKEEYTQKLIDYFGSVTAYTQYPHLDEEGNVVGMKNVPNLFPTLARFATMLGVSRDTLHEWSKATNEDGTLKHPDFSDAYKRAKDYQEALLSEGTLAGAYNPTFAIFTAKNVLGWRDKTEQEITGADGQPLVNAVNITFKKTNEQPESTNS